jgi:methionyl-tRNA synthetase
VTIDEALAKFDFRRAVEAVTAIGDEGNRYIEEMRPWAMAKAEREPGTSTADLDSVLSELVATCRDIAEHMSPFLPAAAQRIASQCGGGGSKVAEPSPTFPRLEMSTA